MSVVIVNNLSHTYDGKRFVLKDINFEVRRGEVFGLLGKNGAGKTTLIKILTTLIKPSSGSVKVLGLDLLRDAGRIRERIGVVQQDSSYDFTTVEKNFEVYGMLWGLGKEEINQRKEELIKTFGLEHVRKKMVFDLSGGEQRRLQVAREFMHEMDLLFLDEPTVGLDVVMRRELLSLIKEKARKGLTIIFTTHNLEEADYLCDRIAIIDKGRMLALDSVENIKRINTDQATVEILVSGQGKEAFLRYLSSTYADNFYVMSDGNAVVSGQDPKNVIKHVLDSAAKYDVRIEWLNARKNTLEDVLFKLLSG